MRLLMLADPNSPHTIKWASSLSRYNIEILIFGLDKFFVQDYKSASIKIITLNEKILKKEGSFSKIRYLKALPIIKNVIKKFNPHILHSHYASSYGLLGALSGFHPFIVSVWGSDVFSFPNKSILHKTILKYVLKKADVVTSTSLIMAKETMKYTNKNIKVIPFGVDLEVFTPMKVNNLFDEKDIVIGTIKSLEEKYGIEYLIRAFKFLVDKYPHLPLKLLIVGGGSLENSLKNIVKKLGIENKTIFTGRVPFSEVPKYHNLLSVFVAISDSESFGVAVVEAMACEKPVVVSNVGGLPEVVENDITGFIVPPRNPEKTAEAIEKLILDEQLRLKMGKAGRERVIKLYDWNKNVEEMIKIYNKILKYE